MKTDNRLIFKLGNMQSNHDQLKIGNASKLNVINTDKVFIKESKKGISTIFLRNESTLIHKLTDGIRGIKKAPDSAKEALFYLSKNHNGLQDLKKQLNNNNEFINIDRHLVTEKKLSAPITFTPKSATKMQIETTENKLLYQEISESELSTDKPIEPFTFVKIEQPPNEVKSEKANRDELMNILNKAGLL